LGGGIADCRILGGGIANCSILGGGFADCRILGVGMPDRTGMLSVGVDVAVSDILKGLIGVTEGKESSALPEEAAHFAVTIIKSTNPALYKQMLKEISSFSIYRQTLNLYKGDRRYQDKDGKPDIAKLKEEAIGKVLAETIILKNEGELEIPENLSKSQSWWQKIIEFFKSLFRKPGFNPFEVAAEKVIKGELTTVVSSIPIAVAEV